MKKLINIIMKNLSINSEDVADFLNIPDTLAQKWTTNGTVVPDRHMKRLLDLYEKVYRVDKDAFADLITGLQSNLDLSDKELASHLKVRQKTLQTWKCGETFPSSSRHVARVYLLVLNENNTPRMRKVRTLREFSRLRRALGVPRNKIAEVLGVSSQTLVYWEAGNGHPKSNVMYEQIKNLNAEFSKTVEVLERLKQTSVSLTKPSRQQRRRLI